MCSATITFPEEVLSFLRPSTSKVMKLAVGCYPRVLFFPHC